jgi:excisionase family DNA binding protein
MEKAKEPFIQIEKVKELTGFSDSYIYKLVHFRKIPHYKPTGKKGKTYFRESEIFDFIARSRQSADYELSEQADAILNGEV